MYRKILFDVQLRVTDVLRLTQGTVVHWRGTILMRAPDQLANSFRALFGQVPFAAQAPGRINIIGEHTDYNEGFVLPCAVNLRCWAAASPRSDRLLNFKSENIGELLTRDLDDLKPLHNWSDYPVGVAAALQRHGLRLRGANLYIHGEVPIGAGLSSSAAIEVATAYALLRACDLSLDRTTIATVCQMAENSFVGANCGIMDQFVSCHGVEGKALCLDCRSLRFSTVTIPHDICLVLCNTMVKHELSQGEYNRRRQECEEGVTKLAAALPGIHALRDVTMTDLESHRNLLSDVVYRRCYHVISENVRVHEMVASLESSDTAEMSRIMDASHKSLRDDYEVSCPELDLMVDIAVSQKGVFGARMMGAGFGGCTVNLVGAEVVPEFQWSLATAYQSATGLRPDIYVCFPARGAGLALFESAPMETGIL